MKKYYVWKELSDDGLLKDPLESVGYGYKEHMFEKYDSEDAAVTAYTEKKQQDRFRVPSELVLITIYRSY